DFLPLRRFPRCKRPSIQSRNAKLPGRAGKDRSQEVIYWKPIWEKLPLLALSALSGVVTFYAQLCVGAVQSLSRFLLSDRIANALVSSAQDIAILIWPQNQGRFISHH